ncbi:hypothetical protein EAF00_001099 [Botryotinia globosa]|nr:hypothetical protein EAF00_001099 [Botryotinia globosa]
MYTLIAAELAVAEEIEEQKIKREKNQSSEEKQKLQTARGRLAQIAKTLPKRDKQTAGTELDMKRLVDGGLLARLRSDFRRDIEQRMESLKLLKTEGNVGEGNAGGLLARLRSGCRRDIEQRMESLKMSMGEGESEAVREEGEGNDGVCREELEGKVEGEGERGIKD